MSEQDIGNINENKSFVVLNAKNCHHNIIFYCKQYDISLKDEMLPSRLAEEGICLSDIRAKQLRRVIAELNLMEQGENPDHLSKHEESIYKNVLDVKAWIESDDSDSDTDTGSEPDIEMEFYK